MGKRKFNTWKNAGGCWLLMLESRADQTKERNNKRGGLIPERRFIRGSTRMLHDSTTRYRDEEFTQRTQHS